jgi:hypothetical protein
MIRFRLGSVFPRLRRGGASAHTGGARGRLHDSSGHRLGLAWLGAVAVVGLAVLWPVGSAEGDTVGLFFSTTAGVYQREVPTGVTSLQVTAVGGTGGTDFSQCGPGCGTGGEGAVVSATVAVTPGEALTITVAANGGNETVAGGGGGSGAGSGGSGGASTPGAVGGGGGGGASAVYDAGAPLVVAGGGGGGGGEAGGGSAGGAGVAGTNEPTCTGGDAGGQSGPGAAGGCGGSSGNGGNGGNGGAFVNGDPTPVDFGGGGGGGGFYGGGGGAYSGGGGGSSYPSSDVTGLDGTKTPSVTITYVTDTTVPDTTPPTTTITLNPTSPNGLEGWYTEAVGVTVSATDNPDGSGVAQTRCVLDPQSVPADYAALPSGECALTSVSADGTHTIYAASVDNAGNVESPVVSSTFEIDTTAPTISAAVTTAPNANGWYDGNVDVHFTCNDAVSGIPPGACPADQILSTEGAAVSSTAETVTDTAGNTSAPSNVVTVKIDKTPPTVTYTNNQTPYGLLATVAITCTAADSLSGVASTTCANVSGTAWSFGPGPHTFSATATDNAGNIGSSSTTFTVVVSSAALCTLTGQFVDGSANYQALKPAQRKAVDVLVNTSCSLIISLGPKLAPGQTQAFINAYKASLETFVKLGWLTQGQAGTLGSLAGAL